MTSILIALIVLAVAGIFFVSVMGEKGDKREKFSKSLAKMFEGAVEPLEGNADSFMIKFRFNDTNFTYEDINDPGFQKPIYRGCLKTGLSFKNFNCSFQERQGKSIRADMQNIGDVISPWSAGVVKVSLPHNLQEFDAYSNNPKLLTALLANAPICKMFEKYKRVDSRGRKVMPLEIADGTLMLRFHPKADLDPNILDLHNRPWLMELFVKDLLSLRDQIGKIRIDSI